MKSILIIARRECGAYFGTPIAWIFIALQIAILSFFFFQFSPFFIIESADMRVWFGLTPFMLMVFAPAVTMRLWSEEMRTGTTEVLLSLPIRVTDRQVAGGIDRSSGQRGLQLRHPAHHRMVGG